MRTGVVILPEHRRSEAESRWSRAEEYGFDHAWTFDHLGWRSLVDGPWFGAVPTLAVAAQVTTRIELGPLVASPNFRHPVPFARELTALDDISAGRLTLGVGAGSDGDYDSKVFGEARPASRSRRFAEFVELLDALLTTEKTTWRGDYYTAVEARNAPGCVQHPRIPFIVAANGPKSMRLATTFGHGWITTGARRGGTLEEWWAGVAEAATGFAAAIEESGRPRDDIRRFLQTDAAPVNALSSVDCYRDFLGRADDLGFTDMVAPWPRPEGVFAASEATLEAVATEVLPTLT